jgi:two-component system chemotaxis response regulator CheY
MPEPAQPVLIIDDFATMTRIMMGIVQQLGFVEVDTCQSGEAALAKLSSRKYGLILCDLEMDGMTGAEFAGRARGNPYAVQCPIVITTANRESAAQCVRDGVHEFVDGFILKPFKAADLQTKLTEIEERLRIKRRHLEQQPVLTPPKEPAAAGA